MLPNEQKTVPPVERSNVVKEITAADADAQAESSRLTLKAKAKVKPRSMANT